MNKYVQGLLPISFNNVWVKREEWRAENFSITLRNSEHFYIPTPLLAQTERHPYFLVPKGFRKVEISLISLEACQSTHSILI